MELALFISCVVVMATVAILLFVIGMAAPEARTFVVLVAVAIFASVIVLYFGFDPTKYRTFP